VYLPTLLARLLEIPDMLAGISFASPCDMQLRWLLVMLILLGLGLLAPLLDRIP
jgi:hypothetical protein